MSAKINIEYIKGTACAGKVKENLLDCLNSRTKGVLSDISKEYSLEGVSKMKKAELAELLCETIVENYKDKLESISAKEKEVYENLCDCDELPLDKACCEDLVKCGIAYVYSSKDDYVVAVPEELREVITEIFTENPVFDKYIVGGISLYGYVEIAFLAKLVASFSEKKEIEIEEEFKEYVLSASAYTNDYVIQDGHIVAKELCENNFEKLEALKKIIAGEPVFKPSKAIFNIYCEGKFEITPQIKKLTDFAYKYVTANMPDAQKIVGGIVLAHRHSTKYALERYAAHFMQNGYKFTTVQVEAKTVALIVEVIENVRLWAYRGYTVTEKKELLMGMKMKAAKRPVAPITTANIGRNDPCPCGSGKKYKKCCGR